MSYFSKPRYAEKVSALRRRQRRIAGQSCQCPSARPTPHRPGVDSPLRQRDIEPTPTSPSPVSVKPCKPLWKTRNNPVNIRLVSSGLSEISDFFGSSPVMIKQKEIPVKLESLFTVFVIPAQAGIQINSTNGYFRTSSVRRRALSVV